ncbi:hypothetical protein PR048_006470 [Dryococelus australis]|uniref:Uncharacterized protein n=1 Tax=Dryococelus australis TaxID=614101 RepID=A0ABQ9IB22_9NEOP|nr:hypothetical protein PR048_006470 [Dryococelus australis]
MMTADPHVAARLRLDCSENRMQRVAVLSEKALADPVKVKLFQVTSWDLGQLCKGFEEDHLVVLAVSSDKEGFDTVGHNK